MVNIFTLYHTLTEIKGLETMDKHQIAQLLRTHGPTVVAIDAAIDAAISHDDSLLADVADVIDGTANIPGFALKHLPALGTIIGIVSADSALLADLRAAVPHK